MQERKKPGRCVNRKNTGVIKKSVRIFQTKKIGEERIKWKNFRFRNSG